MCSSFRFFLLCSALFIWAGEASAKVCMITDPNCNAPLDFTMPDCDDEVVAPQYPLKPGDCEASNPYYTHDETTRYVYGNATTGECYAACRPMTCAEVAKTGTWYKTDNETAPFRDIPDHRVINPETVYPIYLIPEFATDEYKCYSGIMCDTSYYKYPTEFCDSSYYQQNGEECTDTKGTHYKDCTEDCRHPDIKATYKFPAANCNKELYPNLIRSGQYDKTSTNNQCWTTCACPEGSYATAPQSLCPSPFEAVAVSEEGTYSENETTITCSKYECGCPSGYKLDGNLYDTFAPVWKDWRYAYDSLKCVKDFCGELGFTDACVEVDDKPDYPKPPAAGYLRCAYDRSRCFNINK